GGKAAAQLVPETLVAPVLDLLLRWHLHIVAAALGGSHGAEREAAQVIGIDQFVANRRHLGDDAEPAEGIDAFIEIYRSFGNGFTGDAMVAVATGDEIAVDPMRGSVLL